MKSVCETGRRFSMHRAAIGRAKRLLGLARKMTSQDEGMPPSVEREHESGRGWFSRRTFQGAVLFNMATLLIPALYSTLSKLWVAQIDTSMVATTDIYTYLGVINEVLNEGLPRASFLVIGSVSTPLKQRIATTQTLILFQMIGGLLLSILFLCAAPILANTFAPSEVAESSVSYVRITSFSTLFSVTEYVMGSSLRALDRPDVPLVISTTKTLTNIVLDLLFLSAVRVIATPTVNTQAWIRLACDALGASAGLCYFQLTVRRYPRFRLSYLKDLAKPGIWFLLESAVRNALYLWLVAGIVALGSEYATAWGVFNTIRWGIVMVPAGAFADASSAFTGHAWSKFQGSVRHDTSLRHLLQVARYALIAAACVLAVEVILAVSFSLWLAEPLAFYLSGNDTTAALTSHMWSTLDWTYVLFAVALQLSTVLLATWPAWYLVKTLLANLLWVLPWCVALQVISITAESAWTYHALIFGGSLVVDLAVVLLSLALWTYAILHPEEFLRMKKRICSFWRAAD